MKKLIKLISLITVTAIIMLLPATAFAGFQTDSIFTSYTYTHQDRFSDCTILQGVDLSYHNSNVDFAQLKESGVQYVILRAGYTGWTEKHTKVTDTKFATYIKDAIKQGLDIGIYYYSQAVTVEEAKSEAEYTISIIKNYKSNITLPVAFDYEFAEVSRGRFDSRWNDGTLNKEICTSIAETFCDTIAKGGYSPMIYANKSFLSEVLDGVTLGKKYPVWLANYTTNTTYSDDFSIWQFSAKGQIAGTESTYVDANFMYLKDGEMLSGAKKEFRIDAIPDQEHTGSEVKPDLKVTVNGKALIKGEDYWVKFENNVNIGVAKVTVNGLSDYESYAPKTVKYKIVPMKTAGLALTERTAKSLSLKWDENADAKSYKIWLKDGESWSEAGSTEATTFKLDGLAPSGNYTFGVSAVNGKYTGIRSDEFRVCTKPSKIGGLTASKVTSDSITLKWNAQASPDKYIVYKQNSETGKYDAVSEVNGSKNYYKFTELTPNTKYRFKVRAVKTLENGKTINGALSAAYTKFTAPKAPKLKSAESYSYKTITVKWKKSDGASGYQIMWSTTSTFTSNYKSVKVGASSRSTKITTAQSGGSYYVRVRAYRTSDTGNAYSPWSNSIHTYTK